VLTLSDIGTYYILLTLTSFFSVLVHGRHL